MDGLLVDFSDLADEIALMQADEVHQRHAVAREDRRPERAGPDSPRHRLSRACLRATSVLDMRWTTRLGMGPMRFLRTRAALAAGAIGLAMMVGAVGIFVAQPAGLANAQDIDTQFDGIIEALPATGVVGIWQVSGRQVLVTELTAIDAEGQTLVPGLHVEVEGFGQEAGPVLATEIEVEKVHQRPARPIPGIRPVPGIRPADDDD